MSVDLHTHILPERWPDWTARSGYSGWIELSHQRPGCARMQRSEPDGSRRFFREVQSNCWDPSVRMMEMDRAGVEMQVLSTVPVMFSYWARPRDAYELARLLNDHIAGVVRDHPGRFMGLGTVPLQDPSLAVRELERCVRELGLAGVQIGTNVNGRNLDDELVFEVLAACERLGACVFVHPWDMVQWGVHGRMEEAGLEAIQTTVDRMSRYWMPWLVGMPAETTIAICAVLFGGVLDRLANLRICFAHGGGSFAGTVGRIAHGLACRPDLFPAAAKDPRSYLLGSDGAPARFYVDSLVHDPEALRLLLKLFGPERIALGSDYPFPLGEDRPGELIRSLAGPLVGASGGELDGATVDRLLRGSAMQFLTGP